MSEHLHHANIKKNGEHGTVLSYVIGFVLSLVFTAIPYYMVVNKTISGSALLTTIIAIAVLQMLIQIFFFLHLGRGPKPFYNVVFFVATVITILIVIGGSIFIMNNLNYNMAPDDASKYLAEKEGISQVGGEKTGACKGAYVTHTVTIKGGISSPLNVEARLCDRLTFINRDEEVRKVTFGTHPQDGSYEGQTEVAVRKGRSKTIILNEPGTYQFHDHLAPAITGSFKVRPN